MNKSAAATALLTVSFLPFAAHSGASTTEVVGWGDAGLLQVSGVPNFYHQVERLSVATASITNVVALSAGPYHSIALGSDGTVFGWGSNHGGQAIGVETGDQSHTNGLVRINGNVLSNAIAVAAGNGFSLGLKRDGTVVSWGKGPLGASQVPDALHDVVAIAAGYAHSLAVTKEGEVISWGARSNYFAGVSNVVAVATAKSWNGDDVALTREGYLIEDGRGGQHRVPAGFTNFIAVSAGFDHSLALRNDGTVFGWGANGAGQATGIPSKKATDTSMGLVTVDGSVLSNVVAVSASLEYSLAITSTGTVVAWGNKQFYDKVPSSLGNVCVIVAGEGFSLAVATNNPSLGSSKEKP